MCPVYPPGGRPSLPSNSAYRWQRVAPRLRTWPFGSGRLLATMFPAWLGDPTPPALLPPWLVWGKCWWSFLLMELFTPIAWTRPRRPPSTPPSLTPPPLPRWSSVGPWTGKWCGGDCGPPTSPPCWWTGTSCWCTTSSPCVEGWLVLAWRLALVTTVVASKTCSISFSVALWWPIPGRGSTLSWWACCLARPPTSSSSCWRSLRSRWPWRGWWWPTWESLWPSGGSLVVYSTLPPGGTCLLPSGPTFRP